MVLAVWSSSGTAALYMSQVDVLILDMLLGYKTPINKRSIEFPLLLQLVYAMGPFPLPNLAELREKYTYNITPFTAAMDAAPAAPSGKGRSGINIFSDEEDWDDDDITDQINCFAGIFPVQPLPNKTRPGKCVLLAN